METTDFENLRVLIIDDKPHNVRLLRSILGQLGTRRVSTLGNTEEALVLLREERFDLLFVDEFVGPINVVGFSITLRRDLTTKDPTTPILLLSGGTRRRQVELVRDCGANDIVQIPVSIDTVRRKVQSTAISRMPFVATKTFLGPDRRRGERTDFAGEDRRGRASDMVQIFSGRPRHDTPT